MENKYPIKVLIANGNSPLKSPVSKWIGLPFEKKELEEALEDLGIKNDKPYILGWKSDISPYFITCINKDTDLEELNYFAALIDESISNETKYSSGPVYNIAASILEGYGTLNIRKNIKLLMNEDKFFLCPDIINYVDLGKEFIDTSDLNINNAKKSDLKKLGQENYRDLDGRFTENGFIYFNAFDKQYRSKDDIPLEYRLENYERP